MSKQLRLLVSLGLALAGSGLHAQTLGTAFTYQGQLTDGGQPTTGLYDLQLCLFASASAPTALACAPDFEDVPVSDSTPTGAGDTRSAACKFRQRCAVVGSDRRPGGLRRRHRQQ